MYFIICMYILLSLLIINVMLKDIISPVELYSLRRRREECA